MLYGNENIKKEIVARVKRFEEETNRKVVFGAVVGSISKGAERYDSDYDTRFLYLDKKGEKEYIRWDEKGDVHEADVHISVLPDKAGMFYDKIAFWELTSFFNYLYRPILDNNFSVGLYHIVGWTIFSPYVWDPYGIVSKIAPLIDDMFILDYEINYYRNYIKKSFVKETLLLREYLYSVFYAISIQYCYKYHRIAPVYFPTLLEFCNDNVLKRKIESLFSEYLEKNQREIEIKGKNFTRKMTNQVESERSYVIDCFLKKILDETTIYDSVNMKNVSKSHVDKIVKIVLESLNPHVVKDVNEKSI